jgi:hypothetical protein
VATIANLYIDAGTDFNTNISVSTNGVTALNLTGYTVKSQMRKSYSSSQMFEFTTSIYDALQGKIKLEMTDTQTSSIPAGRWLYDIEINSPDNKKSRVVEGIITVTPQITQS